MVTDTISDLLTRIRNAYKVNHRIVKVYNTKMSKSIIHILKDHNFIENFQIIKENQYSCILIYLKYIGKPSKPVISYIQRISKPGLRVYIKSKNLPKVLDGLGIAIISTSKGILTNLQAKKLKIGGEILCHIW